MFSEANQLKVAAEGDLRWTTAQEAARLSFEWYDIANDPHGWDPHVSRLNQNVFHRRAMLEAHQPARGFLRGVLIRRGDHVLAALGGLVTPRQSGGAFRTLSFPGRSHGLHQDTPRELTDWLLSQGMTRIQFGSYDGGTEEYETDPGDRVEERLEFLYDLTLSEDERMSRLNSNHKRKLKRAESLNLRLRRIDHFQPWVMTWLNSTWSRRHGHPLTPRRLVEMAMYYRALTRILRKGQCANLYGLYDEKGRILSMAYMLEHGTSSFYMIGASSDTGYQCGASVRLMWELAREYPRFGIRTLNFGGVPIGARDEGHAEFGVFRFKTGFGIEPILRRSLIAEV